MTYRVELDIFRGPVDLLLFLVRKNELDILDIPLAQITEQYLEYLNLIRIVDVDVAGDFLVMATTLMEIKSRMLLPRVEGAEEAEADPRAELVRQLLEYKRFRDAAEHLEQLAAEQQERLPRIPAELLHPATDPSSEPIRDVELWDLVSAFGRLMRQTLAVAPKNIVYDETPIQTHMERILERLARQGRLAFTELFELPLERGRVVGTFLALLELVKARRIRAEQNEPFGEIWVFPREEPPAAEEPAADTA
jgi:segregation and condensation protein A